jgi:hypothetical protein
MSAQVVESNNHLLTVSISGTLTQPEFTTMQKSAAEILQKTHPLRVLVLATEFTGWTREGNWGDMSFQPNDALITKMAIVTDAKWKELVALFTGKGMRKFPIEIFSPGDIKKAREWLGAEATVP